MLRPLTPALAAAALALAAAGCGSSSSSSGASTAPAPRSDAHTIVVKMANIAFNPSTTTVRLGQTVHWVNEDSVPHNVTATSGAAFHSATFGDGGSFTFRPTRTGVIKYVCTIHPGMDGELRVIR